MAQFTLTSDNDPFLHVSLRRGESITCESNSMVMMEANLELAGEMNGGFLNAMVRSFANDESFFQQRITASHGDGDCLLAPVMPGGMEILEVGEVQYKLSDGAFVASTDGVDMELQRQSLGTALFGGTGGFVIAQTRGRGQLAVSGFGTLFTIEVSPGAPMTIDNGHVVAWDSRLNYELSLSTKRSAGMLSNLVNSFTGGEGVVLKFSGSGKVVLCSRNQSGFVNWLKSFVTPSN